MITVVEDDHGRIEVVPVTYVYTIPVYFLDMCMIPPKTLLNQLSQQSEHCSGI